jgi:hypothetical protein
MKKVNKEIKPKQSPIHARAGARPGVLAGLRAWVSAMAIRHDKTCSRLEK